MYKTVKTLTNLPVKICHVVHRPLSPLFDFFQATCIYCMHPHTHTLTHTHAHTQTLAANKCPTSSETSACLTPWLFVVVVAMQLIVMLGYSIYRQAQERNAKKFF